MKDAVFTMFDWPRDMLDGKTEQSRFWREQVDLFGPPETRRNNTQTSSQEFGTECMREGFLTVSG